MSAKNPFSNADLRKLVVRECFESDCDNKADGNSQWCKFHRKERPLLRKRFNKLNLGKFSKSKLVRRLERSQAQEDV